MRDNDWRVIGTSTRELWVIAATAHRRRGRSHCIADQYNAAPLGSQELEDAAAGVQREGQQEVVLDLQAC